MELLSPQVYMLLVKWSDLTEKLIYRTYPEIYTFHVGSTTPKNLFFFFLPVALIMCFDAEITERDVSH